MNAQLQPLDPAEAPRAEGKLTVHRLIELAEAAGFKRGEVLDLAQERRGLRDNFAARAIHAELTQRGIQIHANTLERIAFDAYVVADAMLRARVRA